jgi:hypothetical protein
MAEVPTPEDTADLKEVITLEEPLGPHESERLFGKGRSVFQWLYDKHSIHYDTTKEQPHFIIGRKGAGKTALLMGAASSDSDVVRITSESVYQEVAKLSVRYTRQNGPIVSDSLAHVWEVFLYHVAMLAIVRGEPLREEPEWNRIWAYMSSFGDPGSIKADSLFAAVGAEMSAAIEEPGRLAFREACWSLKPGQMSFREAADLTRAILAEKGSGGVHVVVDNLEELHRKVDEFAEVVTALFRLVSLSEIYPEMALPFAVRFAFPAELHDHLETLTANPDKDFRSPLTIRWTAGELIMLAGNRLRTFLDLYFPDTARQLGLPKKHNPTDRLAARRTLAAVLPEQVRNDLGTMEDAIPYLMRHTQLLPRHLIQILNQVMQRAVVDALPDGVPRATSKQLVEGVNAAERRIVKAIFTAYSHDYEDLRKPFNRMKNHVAVMESVSDLHTNFNNASASVSGYDFDRFLAGSMAVGAIGVVTDVGGHYIKGEFSYTFTNEMRTVEARDKVCIHPLFVSELFDQHRIAELAKEGGHLPVYPYGSDPSDDKIEK